jgi:DNA-binding beta-propeller fold protein YncE
MDRNAARLLAPLAIAGFATISGAQNALVNWETPHVTPLALTPGGARLLAVNTPDNRLEVFTFAAGRLVRALSIPVGLDPVSVRARTDGEAWVVNHVSDSISVVDLALGHVVATLATDDEPCDVVFAGLPSRAFVSCSQANTVLVFDPLDLAAPPVRIPIRGEDPRALAVSRNGDTVYAAIFDSGNRTTVLGGGAVENIGFPPNVVSDADGPHGGANPPPNAGAAFDPPLAPGLPAPPPVGLIVRQDHAGRWLDDSGGDWTEKVSGAKAADSGRPVGWKLLDHDVAVIDAATLAVSYADGLMNLNMALAVHPTGAVTVVGTEALNVIRFEPRVRGTFVRARVAGFLPANPGTVVRRDLNPHLDYSIPTVPQGERDKSIGDPRGIVWNATGTKAYITGMGSNNVIVVDALGRRAGLAPAIEVGEGPTGIVLDPGRAQLYVLDKFEASISVVSTVTETEVARVPFFDPSPPAIKRGRKHLYDTHETSGNGVVACASCHVDARMDHLAWDLGVPDGAMKAVDNTQNLGANVPLLNTGFEDWHPMKGPMLTQTLQDIVGKEPHHWRGDRDGLEEFSGAFVGLLGDDETLTAAEMQEFEDFLATIFYPPNPFRNADNTLPTNLPLPGHYTTGRFAPAGQPLPNGNALAGLNSFRPPVLLDMAVVACVTCHTRSTGAGTDHRLVGFTYQPFPVGPKGEHHLALVSQDGLSNVSMKVPHLRNLYERTGFNLTQPESTAGFGYVHDGSVDSIERFVDEPVFGVRSDQETANLVALMLAFGGTTASFGSTTALLEPPGPTSQSSHAAVGKQLTLDGPASADEDARLDMLVTLAGAGQVGLVAKGRQAGLARGWYYVGSDVFQSDRQKHTLSRAALEALAAPGAELTFTVVPKVSERRIGVDRDADGWYDRDELDAGSDPADPEPTHVRLAPPGERP